MQKDWKLDAMNYSIPVQYEYTEIEWDPNTEKSCLYSLTCVQLGFHS